MSTSPSCTAAPSLRQASSTGCRPDLENRVKEGSIAALFEAHATRITPEHVHVEQRGRELTLPADVVFVLTGYHSDTTLLAQAGVGFDPVELTPHFEPETFETNVPDVFLVGNITTGRQTNRIFIENGRFHGERVIEVIAARLQGRAAHDQPPGQAQEAYDLVVPPSRPSRSLEPALPEP